MLCHDCKEKLAVNNEGLYKLTLEMETIKHSGFLLYKNY